MCFQGSSSFLELTAEQFHCGTWGTSKSRNISKCIARCEPIVKSRIGIHVLVTLGV